MDSLRIILKRYKNIAICLLAVLLVLAGNAVLGHMRNSVSTQQPEERWSSNGDNAAHIAAYYPEDEGVTDAEIKGYRNSLDTALTEASVEIKKDARRYLDAYSCSGSVEIAKEGSKEGTKVNVTAVGGDFFFIHPQQLLSGNYISESELMNDKVVIDEYTAWLIFGSTNVSGKYITISGKYFYVAGVVKPHDSLAAKKTYGIRSRIYMSYSAYSKLVNSNANITCYEIVFPDMITNFAYNEMKKVLGVTTDEDSVDESSINDEKGIQVVNVTTRFRYRKLWNVMMSYGERSSEINGIVYPYWENECRRIEDFGVLILIWNMIFLVIAIIEIIPDSIKAAKFIISIIKNGINKLYRRFGFK